MKILIVTLISLALTYLMFKDLEKQAPINRTRQENMLNQFKDNGLQWCVAELSIYDSNDEKRMILKRAISEMNQRGIA